MLWCLDKTQDFWWFLPCFTRRGTDNGWQEELLLNSSRTSLDTNWLLYHWGMWVLGCSPDTKKPSFCWVFFFFWTHGKDYVRVKMWEGKEVEPSIFSRGVDKREDFAQFSQSLSFISSGKQNTSKMEVLSLNPFPESWIYPEGTFFFFLEARISNNFCGNYPAPIVQLSLLSSFHDYLIPNTFLRESLERFSQKELFKIGSLFLAHGPNFLVGWLVGFVPFV